MASKNRIAELQLLITASAKKYNDASNKVISISKRTANGMTNAYKKVGGVIAGAFAISRVYSFAKETGKAASEAKGVEQAFNRLGNSSANLDKLTRSTRGTVSELELMKQAVRAENFDIPLDVLAKGLEFATKRAAQTGESVDYLVNSFVTGLGRKSVLILDNLGISASQLNEEVKKTGDFMQAVVKIADRGLKQMGDVIETDAQKMARFKSNIENAKIQFGELVNRGFTPFINVGNKLLENITKSESSIRREQEAIQTAVQAATLYAEGTDERTRALNNLKNEYPQYFANIDSETTKNSELKVQLDNINKAYAQKIVILKYEKELSKVAGERQKIYRKTASELEAIRVVLDRDAKLTTEFVTNATAPQLIEAFKKYVAEAEKYNYSVAGGINNLKIWIKNLEEAPQKLEDISKSEEDIQKAIKTTLDLLELSNQAIEEGGGVQAEVTDGSEKEAEAKKETVEYTGIIARLEAQIKQLNEDKLNAEEDQLGIINSQIEALEKQKQKLNELRSPAPEVAPAKISGQTVTALSPIIPVKDEIKPLGIQFNVDLTPLEALEHKMANLRDQGASLGERLQAFFEDDLIGSVLNYAEFAFDTLLTASDAIGSLLEKQKQKELQQAGSNEKKRAAIEEKFAKKQKRLATAQAVINSLLGFTKALGSADPPFNFILAAAVLASGLAQAAAINATALAEGGIAYGPTYALIGEAGPEAVIPLDRYESNRPSFNGLPKYIQLVATGKDLKATIDLETLFRQTG